MCNVTSQSRMQAHSAMEKHCKAESHLDSTPANVTCTSQHKLLHMTLFFKSEEINIIAFHSLPHYLPHFADTFTEELVRSFLSEHRVKPRTHLWLDEISATLIFCIIELQRCIWPCHIPYNNPGTLIPNRPRLQSEQLSATSKSSFTQLRALSPLPETVGGLCS